ncbi:hypothetical protein [Piscinibacter koreensis]|uniref:Uncharacterized protein n=1 Tax=Piscinibacter koreensis TaxID=2742824 RepID=A0A7Y6TXA1_9BURK|nr:hypothetical protein [Schlegelella koreensis]NUZ06934.1 hypothetical protein [Schlegelella koreensis]
MSIDPVSTLARGASAALVFGLAACGSIRSNEDAQAVVTRELVGMPIGEFIERYGAPAARSEAPDGSLSFNWESRVGSAPAGPMNLDDRVCKLFITGNRAGRIVTAKIRNDTVGRTSASRCGEMFVR